MLQYLIGGAVILLGGVYVACSLLEEENKIKSEELERKSRDLDNALTAQLREIERIRQINDKKEKAELYNQRFFIHKKKSDSVYKSYNDAKKELIDYNNQLKAALDAKNKAKEELNTLKSNSPEYKKTIEDVRTYGELIKNIIAYRDKNKDIFDAILAKLQKINHETHSLNLERQSLNSSVLENKICINCYSPFSITISESKFFKDKGLTVPKRCKACRQEKKSTSNSDYSIHGATTISARSAQRRADAEIDKYILEHSAIINRGECITQATLNDNLAKTIKEWQEIYDKYK